MQPTAAQRRTWTGAAAAGRSAAASALHRLAAAAQAQRGQWPLWLPVCFGAGIGVYFSLSAEPPLWLLLPAAVIAAAPIALARRWRGGILFGVFAFAFVAGFAVAQWRALTVAAPVLSQRTGPVVVTGQLIKVERRERDVRLLFDHVNLRGLTAEHTPMRVRVVARAVPTGILPGHWLRVPAVLMPPPRPARPGGFDFASMASFLQLGGVGYAVGRAERVPASAGSEAWSPVTRLNALRQRLSERIRTQLPGPTGAVAAALITGDRGAIPKDSVEAMRVSGLAHLLAISGLHIGLVAGTIFFAVRLGLALIEPVALRYPIKKWAALAALLGAFGYLLLSGATVPTQRAFLMAALALGAVLIDRNPISMRLVAFAAVIVLLAQPESLLGASFQMSFAAVLALVAVYEHAGAWAGQAGFCSTSQPCC